METNSRHRRTAIRAGAVVTAAVLAVSATGAVPAAAAASPRAELQTALDDLRDLGMVGAQGEISSGRHNVVAGSGVADRHSGRPMPLEGRFRIGSNTKTFVSVVALQLVGEGRLSLDDTVERRLPGVVSGNGNDGRRITVRQLLQHTSGLHNYTEDLAALGSAEDYLAHRFDHYDPADLVALAMKHEPSFRPGARWEYSNTNYILAGMIIERVTGRSWATEVRSRILRPLGLHDTSYPQDRTTLPRPHARSYQQFGPGAPLIDVTEFNPTAAGAAGGMVSTTADLTRFWRAVQRGELLRPAQVAQMHRTVLADGMQDIVPGIRYGLGIFGVPNDCGGFWGHPGDVVGTSTFNGVTGAGDRAVVLYRTTGLADQAPSAAVDNRILRLVDDVLC
ncbi:serine hydrolase domain-containing protein [Paractinoplanes hotanensis]|uniref:Beta-lactamase family protein n=1 Tax=Paractinoplanes hotanensis TaxID=2906497 RepID=A0ABT0YA08_9ACTN|nr:serine hydrolase domain-containing protein [Actinoplanes hotanensis]MCM4082883.1 beta-lactamase family protein [Actinoplanes hotanensis]